MNVEHTVQVLRLRLDNASVDRVAREMGITHAAVDLHLQLIGKAAGLIACLRTIRPEQRITEV